MLTINTARSEMLQDCASEPKVQGGKIQKLKNIFQNCESKEDCEKSKTMGILRGQNSCLAVPTNKMQDTNDSAINVIGGDFVSRADGTIGTG